MTHFFKLYMPTILAITGALATALTPALQQYLSQHPVLAAYAAGLAIIISHLWKSPINPSE